MSRGSASALIILHFLFFIVSIFIEGSPDDVIFTVISNINSGIVNPVFTLLAGVFFFFQASVTWPSSSIGALSMWTLLLQSITFLLLAISWPFRLILPPNMWKLGSKPALLMEWYPWVGWACVNNALMAVGQGFMLLVVHKISKSPPLTDGEAQPLLS